MTRAPKRSASALGDDSSRPSQKLVPRTYRPGARSCEGCHQRKVRCDRGEPCINCSKHGMTCVYPTRDPDAVRKPPTLRDISNCLERLESLLSGLAESGESTIDDSAGCAEPEIYQTRPGASVNAIEPAKQLLFKRPPKKSTWEILLKVQR